MSKQIDSRKMKEWKKILARFQRIGYKPGIEILEQLIEYQDRVDTQTTNSRQ
jgi:hypothetical protein